MLLPLYRGLPHYTLVLKRTQRCHSVLLWKKLHFMKGNKNRIKICYNTKSLLSLPAKEEFPFVPHTVCVYHLGDPEYCAYRSPTSYHVLSSCVYCSNISLYKVCLLSLKCVFCFSSVIAYFSFCIIPSHLVLTD